MERREINQNHYQNYVDRALNGDTLPRYELDADGHVLFNWGEKFCHVPNCEHKGLEWHFDSLVEHVYIHHLNTHPRVTPLTQEQIRAQHPSMGSMTSFATLREYDWYAKNFALPIFYLLVDDEHSLESYVDDDDEHSVESCVDDEQEETEEEMDVDEKDA